VLLWIWIAVVVIGLIILIASAAPLLGRLLNLVPYLLARPGIAVAEAAAALGVTERQLREDLELLLVCGLPG